MRGTANRLLFFSSERSFKQELCSILGVILVATTIVAQQPSSSPNRLSDEEQQLINARRANEEAQAEYYREQTKKLNQPPSFPPAKKFWQSIAENPASVLGVIGVIVAALFAAGVGLLTLFVNNRASLRVQRDTQFYEAMKRFGDKDSPSLRASACGILSQMASIELRDVDVFHPVRSYKTKKRPYFLTARDQLVGGLLFEENTTAKLYLRSAIMRLVDVNPTGTARMLYNVNRALQERLRAATAKFLIAMGSESLDRISEEVWTELSYIGVYDVDDLKCFTNHDKKRSDSEFKRRLIKFKALNESDRKSALGDHSSDLDATAYSMYLNVDILSYAFRNNFVSSVIRIPPAFLVNADLQNANLAFCNLQNAFLMKAQMQNVLLFGAQLQGARLKKANIRGSMLAGAHINEQTDLEDVNWWEADFSVPGDNSIDEPLLKSLYQR